MLHPPQKSFHQHYTKPNKPNTEISTNTNLLKPTRKRERERVRGRERERERERKREREGDRERSTYIKRRGSRAFGKLRQSWEFFGARDGAEIQGVKVANRI